MVFYVWLSKNHIKHKQRLHSNEASCVSYDWLLAARGPGSCPDVGCLGAWVPGCLDCLGARWLGARKWLEPVRAYLHKDPRQLQILACCIWAWLVPLHLASFEMSKVLVKFHRLPTCSILALDVFSFCLALFGEFFAQECKESNKI